MAKELDDGEFWLPPQFLNEDESPMEFKSSQINRSFNRERDGLGFFPYEYSYGFCPSGVCSDLSSPVESVVGSTETESDEEDYIAELTRKIAQSTLQDDIWKSDSGFGCEEKKIWGMAGSPQSTLCGYKQGFSRGSPNFASKVSSPPVNLAVNGNENAWDLLYAAAGEVARMRAAEEGAGYFQNRGVSVPPRKPSPVSAPLQSSKPSFPNPNARLYSNVPQSYQQLQVSQFQHMKQQQMLKHQNSAVWGQSRTSGQQFQQENLHQMAPSKARNPNARPLNWSPSAWPTLQQSQKNTGSGMRAVFLGDPSSKRERSGTGVFLPRRVGNPTETRKKPACSTVLLPDRVVQALNLNLQEMDSAGPEMQSRFPGTLSSDLDATSKYRNNGVVGLPRRNFRPPPVIHSEVRLPQEWTY